MHRVHLSGGIGNQLFQIAYAWVLSDERNATELVHYTRDRALPHTNISATILFKQSSRLNSSLKNIYRITEFFDPWNAKYLHRRKLHDFTGKPNYIPNAGELKYKNIIGYFQNCEILKSLSDDFFINLENGLQKFKIDEEFGNATIIHFRRGDTKVGNNPNLVGLLGQKYYSKAIDEVKKLSQEKIILLTDDLSEAKSYFIDLPIDLFLQPNKVTPFAALELMSKATNLIISNSTFAWWGGVLAARNGGQVFSPNPFFKGIIPNPLNSYSAPNFRLIESTFE